MISQRHLGTLAAAVACGGLGACSSSTAPGPSAETSPVEPVAARFPIDGDVDLSTMSDVSTAEVTLRSAFGAGGDAGTTTLRWAMINDDRDVYMAFEWDDDSHDSTFDVETGPITFDGVRVLFDEDADGTHALGEDARTVIATGIGSQYVDLHRVPEGDSETDRVGDGYGKLAYHPASARYVAELLIPLADDGTGEDGPLTAATRFNLAILEGVDLPGGTGNVGYAFDGATVSTAWPSLDLDTVATTGHPEIPGDVIGLIVFISDHETPNGEVYAFDPVTRQVSRVTTAPDLYKDAVSLSHDRTRVAFHGSPTREDYDTYEIYTAGIDGNDLHALTDNAVLDGHPAWAPGDSVLAYASFRGGAGASIVMMTAGGEEIADLTPDPVDDNDPDFLPDGRIVFKTTRFSSAPEVRIAVMNADGTGVVQLSDVSGVSDHDPTGIGDRVLFERFPRPTSYVEDEDAGFVGWDIVQVPLDGGPETTLVSNGWVNWLPVVGPARRYVVYLEGSGTTDAQLMTTAGEHFGRLIPDQTMVRYIDWK